MSCRESRNKRLCVLLLVCNVVFIWGNSLLPASISGAISQWLHALLQSLFPGGKPSQGDGLLRKLAHVSEFALLGALLSWNFLLRGRKMPRWAGASLVCAWAVACVDETIQRFIPGRGPSVRDVLIDTAGALLGIGMFLGIKMLLQKYRKKSKINA